MYIYKLYFDRANGARNTFDRGLVHKSEKKKAKV
jgi:hypothetical protein